MARREKTNSDSNDKTLPIKDTRQQNNMLHYWLSIRNKANGINEYLAHRNYLFIFLGLNTAFRCEDLLQLRPKDLDGGYIRIKENKTGKTQNFKLNNDVYKEVQLYCKKYDIGTNDYLFQSRQKNGVIRAINRHQAWRIIKRTTNAVGIKYKVGVHSLRKTFGYNFISKGGNVLTLMKMYNHSSPAITLLYVMWDSTDVENERTNVFNGIKSL